MTESFDIVNLIEKNPITRLSKDYQSKLIEKIKAKFTDTQQQLFVSSFYCYLNYDSKKEFIIDLDNVWKWIGFSRKDPAKVVLDKNFVKDIDYKILLQQPMEQTKHKRGGSNKEQILMNINTFKKLCLKADTKKADEIHDYYLCLEELLYETLNEETDELRNQLIIKENKIQTNEKNKKMEKHDLLIEKFNYKRCVYIVEIIENKYIKIGSTKDISSRIKSFRRDYKNQNIIFLDVFECQNFREVEEGILQDEIIRKNLYKGNIAGHCSKEIIELSSNITYKQLNEIVKNYVNTDINLFTPQQLLEKNRLEFENKKLDYDLLNNIITNDKYSKTVEQILKDTLPNIIHNINYNLTNNNNQIDIANTSNKSNNIINNVEIDNGKQIKFSYKMNKATGRKVIKIDPNDFSKIIKVYDSITYVIKNPDNLRFSKSELQLAIKNNRIYKGYRWAYVEKGTEPKDCKINPTNKSLEKISGPILELNSDKTLILDSFKTQIILAEHLKITKEKLRKIIINRLKYDDKYYLEFDKCPNELINKYNKPINAKLNHNSISIKQINPITNEVIIFKSLKDVEERLGISHSTIHKAIEKKHLHCGFLWEYNKKQGDT